MLRRLTSIPLRLLGNAITIEQSLINYLRENISGLAIVDMDGADYELSRSEAAKSVIVVIDSGNGSKTITYNSNDNDITPTNILFVGIFSNGFIVKHDGGSATAIIEKSATAQIAIVPAASFVFSITDVSSESANRRYNSRREMADITEDLSHNGYAGKLVVTTNPLATIITIKDISYTDMHPNEKGIIRCANTAGLTIQGDTGIVINDISAGSFVMVKNQIAHWFYNSATDSYEIG